MEGMDRLSRYHTTNTRNGKILDQGLCSHSCPIIKAMQLSPIARKPECCWYDAVEAAVGPVPGRRT